jgi:hypothetical protein
MNAYEKSNIKTKGNIDSYDKIQKNSIISPPILRRDSNSNKEIILKSPSMDESIDLVNKSSNHIVFVSLS